MARRVVRELMTLDVVCTSPKASLRDAARRMVERHVSAAPVVDESGAVLGIVTQNDLARYAARHVTVGEAGQFFTDEEDFADLRALPSDPFETPVEQVMSTPVRGVNPDDSVATAAHIMRERRIHRVVVTERGRLVGILSSLDLMRVVEEAI